MNENLQTALALGLVALALGFLVWRGVRRRGRSTCDDAGCGCGKRVLRKPGKQKTGD